MIQTKKLVKVGNSLGLIIDKKLCEKLNLIKGDLLEIRFTKVEEK